MALVNKEEFYSAVYQTVLEIPYGKVATYGQIAKLVGLPTYSRQVGSALTKLDIDSKIPWHRVVNAQGKTYPRHNGQPSLQQERLETEGIEFNNAGKIPLKKFQWCP